MNLHQHKQALLATKAELEARLTATHRHLQGRSESVSPNFHEQVVETSNDALIQALDQEGRHELQLVLHALERLEAGHYGACVCCGKPIAEARLQALPYAECCIGCA